MILTMGWRDMFNFGKTDKRTDAAVSRVLATKDEQEASYNRLEETIQRVIDAKNNNAVRRRNGKKAH